MNYKHGRNAKDRQRGLKMQEVQKEPDVIYCLTFGCGKKLKPTELLYGNYCFNCAADRNKKERERLKMISPNANYRVDKYRWELVFNKWDHIRTITITPEKFSKYIHGEDYSRDDTQVYYRYDLYVNGAIADIIYSYNPNLYD